MSAETILTLNAGSSSLKFGVYRALAGLPPLLSGQVSGLGRSPRLRAAAPEGTLADEPWSPVRGLEETLEQVFDWLDAQGRAESIIAVGHRIVHGGRDFVEPAILDGQVLARLAELARLAPLHQPFNLRGVAIAARRFPDALQVGVFDTAFHASRPEVARLYALPHQLFDEGVMAYGFHGLSYDYIACVLRRRYGPRAGGRTIVLHLGSGVSLCAMDRGRSLATTMGFSPLDGPPMSTRSGSIDPAIILYLLQHKGMTPAEVSELLYHRSGLLGVSGLSGDMITLLASTASRARQALDLYVYRIAREVGSLAASLGGLDTLVFTAGVGENAAPIREQIATLCNWLGVVLDKSANQAAADRISTQASRVEVLIIPTDEQAVIARGAFSRLGDQRYDPAPRPPSR